jgi:hypothetical protein
MRTVTFPHRLIAAAVFVLITAGSALSQSDGGAIVGSILDSSGGAIEGAAITATGVETGTVYQTTSTSTGAYRFPNLALGHYNISVTAKGFKVSTATGVEVQINSTSSLDITLQPGDVKETMTVVADAPRIQTESSEMGTVIGSREILELPLSLNSSGQSYLRSPETFVFLAPGTQGPGTNQNGNNSSGIFESKLSGGQNFGTEVLLDGVSTTRSDSGSAFDQTAPSVEVLSEFKVLTSTFSAEYGRTSGGIESFATKSGTNDYHGTAFDLFRNTALDANSWDNNFHLAQCTTAACRAANQRPPDHQNDFGGSLGGPVSIPKLYDGRQKTFFFFSWEQYRNNPGTTSLTTLPTTTEIQNGNFSALLGAPLMNNGQPVLNPCDNTPVLAGQIFNPLTTSCPTGFVGGRVAFPGNIVPPGMFDSVAKKILGFLTVSPNLPGTNNGLQNNFVFRSSQQQRDTTMSFRIDENWGTKNKFFFSYSSRDQETPAGADTLPGVLNPNFFNSNFTHYLRGGWNYTIAPNLLNTFTVGFNRLNNLSKADSVNGTDWPAALGIGNASGLVFPQISFNGSPLGIGYQGFSSQSFNGHIPNSLVTAENLRWIKGSHSFDFGFEWRAYQYSFIALGDTSPNYTFTNFQTAFAPNNTSTGDPFASFLLGLPNQAQLSDTLANPRLSSNYYAAYVQDDFKLRRDLTLNLGLRYDVDTPRKEDHGDQSSLNLNTPNPGAPGENGALLYGSASNQGKTYFKDFGPRVGFAYAPTELFGHIRNVVVRGGYAIYYASLFYDDLPTGTIQFSNGNVVQPTFTSQDQFTPVQSLSAGFPNFAPPVNSTNPSRLNGQNVGYIAPSYGRPARTQNWSLEVQKQLAPDLILSLGYVGVKGDYLHTNIAQVNALNPKYYNLGSALTDSVTSPAGQAVLTNLGVTVPSWFVPLYGSNALVGQLLRPFPQYLAIGGSNNNMCSCLENLGISTYNAFQAKLERRFRNGLNLLASYTFSKTLTNADSAIPVFSGFQSNQFAAQDPFNPKTQKGYSFQDTPHMLVLSYIYELPAGPGKKYLNHGVASKVLGGWQVGGVQRYQSGTPTVLNNYNVASAPFTDGAFRNSLVPGQPILAANHGSFNPFASSGCTEQPNGTFTANTTNNYFNCAAFMDPNASALVAQRGYVYGNAPLILGNVRSQSYFNEDFAILKRTTIRESQSIVFKVDIPNAFNRHVFGTRDGYIGDSTFGVSGGGGYTIASPVRQIQLTLRYQF